MVVLTKEAIIEVIQALVKAYNLKDLREVKQFLGFRIIRNRAAKTITIDQEQYNHKILERFMIEDYRPIETPLPDSFKANIAPDTNYNKETKREYL